MPKVLFLALGNTSERRVAAADESRAIRRSCRTHAGSQVEWIEESDLKADEFRWVVRQAAPDVLHFSGHGSEDGSLVFEGDSIPPHELAAILKTIPNCRVAVLNACYSRAVAAMLESVSYVVAMPRKILDKAAITFSSELYRSLVDGADLASAVQSASGVAGWRSDDESAPILHKAANAPENWRLVKKEDAELRACFAEPRSGGAVIHRKAVGVVLSLRGVAEGTEAVLYELSRSVSPGEPDGIFCGAGPGVSGTFEGEIWAKADSTVRVWLLSPGYLRTFETSLSAALEAHYAPLVTHPREAERLGAAFAMIELLKAGSVHPPSAYEKTMAIARRPPLDAKAPAGPGTGDPSPPKPSARRGRGLEDPKKPPERRK